jgi:hypothetical protein
MNLKRSPLQLWVHNPKLTRRVASIGTGEDDFIEKMDRRSSGRTEIRSGIGTDYSIETTVRRLRR